MYFDTSLKNLSHPPTSRLLTSSLSLAVKVPYDVSTANVQDQYHYQENAKLLWLFAFLAFLTLCTFCFSYSLYRFFAFLTLCTFFIHCLRVGDAFSQVQ